MLILKIWHSQKWSIWCFQFGPWTPNQLIIYLVDYCYTGVSHTIKTRKRLFNIGFHCHFSNIVERDCSFIMPKFCHRHKKYNLAYKRQIFGNDASVLSLLKCPLETIKKTVLFSFQKYFVHCQFKWTFLLSKTLSSVM